MIPVAVVGGSLVVALLLGLLFGYRIIPAMATWAVRSRWPTAAPPILPRSVDEPDTRDCRTAVHEAGHLATAWFCTNIVRFHLITIEHDGGELGGRVLYLFGQRTDRRTDQLWTEIVIDLAGMAAEVMVYGRCWSGPARKDLLDALRIASELVDRDATMLPWPWPMRERSLTFAKMYDQVGEREVAILEQAYRAARFLLDAYGPRFYQAVGLLVDRRTITEADAAAVLGPRQMTKILGTAFMAAPSFVVPNLSTATPPRAVAPPPAP